MEAEKPRLKYRAPGRHRTLKGLYEARDDARGLIKALNDRTQVLIDQRNSITLTPDLIAGARKLHDKHCHRPHDPQVPSRCELRAAGPWQAMLADPKPAHPFKHDELWPWVARAHMRQAIA